MRKGIHVLLLCAFFIALFYSARSLFAQTTGFSKISPGWNQTLWKTDYTYTWTFSWKPYSGSAAFDHYVIKFFNNSNALVKQISVPGGKTATSMLIDFTNMPEIVKGNTYYTWRLGAYNGSSATPVAEADSMPSSSGFTSGFRVPLYTADTKSWTINAVVNCPAGTILNRDMRPFWAAWSEGQNHPMNFDWSYQPYSKSANRTVTITNRTENDTLYFGLESDLMVSKPLYYNGTTTEPLELLPTSATMPWAANMDDQTKIYRTRAFNPYTNMAEWRRGLPGGTYTIPFAIPTPYDQEWCAAVCSDSDQGHNYTGVGNLTGGLNACPNKVCTDTCTGTSVNEWYCDGPLAPKQETVDCPSGSCTAGACAPGVCVPTLNTPQTGARITVPDPVITWNQCTGAKYSQINITGTGVDRTVTTGANIKSYTLTGMGFQTNSTYTWKVRACTDAACANTGSWSTANSFKYYICTKSNGDADCENGTDDNDYAIWKCEYLGGGTCANPASTKSADFNSDGKVDLVDFEIWRSHRY